MEGTFFRPGFFDEDDEAVWVNNHAALAMTVPFGGLLEYTEQALCVPKK
jgi:hypothetical protein